jgi:hypothetical protein
LLVVIPVGQDEGGRDCRDDDRRRDRTSDNGQGPTTTSLLGAAFPRRCSLVGTADIPP